MTYGPFNIPAILLSAIVSLALSFGWFTVLFRNAYIADLGKSAEELARGPSMVAASGLQFAGFLAMATGLAWLMSRTGMQGVRQALLLSLIVWFAFVVAILGPMYAYQAFSLRFFAIVAGGYLVPLVTSGIILGIWRT